MICSMLVTEYFAIPTEDFLKALCLWTDMIFVDFTSCWILSPTKIPEMALASN